MSLCSRRTRSTTHSAHCHLHTATSLSRVGDTHHGSNSILKHCYFLSLRMMGITSLEERRLIGDMIEVYKLSTGKEQIDHRQFFNSADHHMASEDTRRNWQRTDPDWTQGNSSLVKWSMDGTIFRQKSSIRNQLTTSGMPTTATTAKIWTTEADQLPVHQPISTSTSTSTCISNVAGNVMQYTVSTRRPVSFEPKRPDFLNVHVS